MAQQRFFPRPQQLLLLKFCLLRDPDAARLAWRKWRQGIDLDDLDNSCFRIMSLVYRRMVDLGIDDPDLARIKGLHRYHWTRNQLAWRGKDEVVRALQEKGIPTLLLKGAALSRTVYPEPTTRGMHDLDILVPVASAATAMGLLTARGWVAQHVDAVRTIDYLHACSFLHPEFGELDLHWHVLRSCCQEARDNEMWQAARDFSFAGVATKILCPADQLLNACEHGQHPSPASALQWLVDATFIVRNSPAPFDWPRLIDQTRRARLVLTVRRSLHFIRRHFEPALPREVLAELDAIPVPALERTEYFLAGRSEKEQAGAVHRTGVALCHFLKLKEGSTWNELAFQFIPYLRILNQERRPWLVLLRDECVRLLSTGWENVAELGFRLQRFLLLKSAPVGGPIVRWPQDRLRGFFPVEKRYSSPFRWSKPEASIELNIPPEPHCLRLQMHPFRDLTRLMTDGLTLSVNGHVVAGPALRFSGNGRFLVCPLEAAWLKPSTPQTLTWSIRPLVAPGDPRELGLPLARLWVYRHPTSPCAS
jgi:hypothetical protein